MLTDAAATAQLLFSLGTILLILGLAAHLGHAVLLAAGRRPLAVAVTAAQPAYATVATGSFVTAHGSGRLPAEAEASPLARAAILLTAAGFVLLGGSVLARGFAVGRGPWGNLYEFSVAFAF